ncbi:hypothetical protein GC177_02320 [bacterium]|nr:hypothetical protein [bacterium]
MHKRELFKDIMALDVAPYEAAQITLLCDKKLRLVENNPEAASALADAVQNLSRELKRDIATPRLMTTKNSGIVSCAIRAEPPIILIDQELFDDYCAKHSKRLRSLIGHELYHLEHATRDRRLMELCLPHAFAAITQFNEQVRAGGPVTIAGHDVRIGQLFIEDSSIPIFRNQCPADYLVVHMLDALVAHADARRYIIQSEFAADLWGGMAGTPNAMFNLLADIIHKEDGGQLHPRTASRRHLLGYAADNNLIQQYLTDFDQRLEPETWLKAA